MDYSLGELIYSKAGRDVGKILLVVKVIDDKYILVSDGNLRKIEKPKKKKVKHIETCGVVIDSLKEKLENNIRVYNNEIKKEIKQHAQNIENLKRQGGFKFCLRKA